MKTNFKITTNFGKYSAIFSVITLVLVLVVIVYSMNLEVSTLTAEDTRFFGNMPLAILTIVAITSLTISFITGLFAVFRKKEKSVLVYLSIAFGALVLFIGSIQVFS